MNMHSIGLSRSMFGMVALAFSMSAQAVTTLDGVGAGWFTNAGEHQEGNSIYAVGGGLDGFNRNNFFLFDVSSVAGSVTAATLRVLNPGSSSAGVPFGYTSSDPTETYVLFDVVTDFYSAPTGGTHLVGGYGAGSIEGQGIFNDLGSGTSYGSHVASLADNGKYVEISLNAAGLAALNSSTGIFAIGGAITTLDAAVNRESLFVSGVLGGVPNWVQLNVTTVPEPSESVLLLAGLGMVLWASRRRTVGVKASSTI